jgi:tetratricopeptide (TPR) repeat protein
MANRYMYIPLLGILIIAGWGVKDFIDKRPQARIAAAILGVIVLSSFLVLTRMQVRHWQNTLTLFDYALKVTKDNPVAENIYGSTLFAQGRSEEAEIHLRNAVRLAPAFVSAINSLAKVYLTEGRYDEAIANLYEIIRHNEGTAEIYYNMATALSLQRKYDEAIKYYKNSLELEPQDPDTHKRMGITLLAAGRIDEAIGHLNESLRIRGGQAEVYTNLGTAYSQSGRYELAIQNWKSAIEIQPGSVDVLNDLGRLLAACSEESVRNASQAIEYSRRACELTGYNEAEYLDTLGIAYAATGKFDDAKTTAEKALGIAKASGQEKLAGEIEKRIKLYEAGQPYRQK